MGEILDFFKSKQFAGYFSLTILLIAFLSVPNEDKVNIAEAFFGTTTTISEKAFFETLRENAANISEIILDQGLGGSPYQTEKSFNYLVGQLGARFYVLWGNSGALANYSTDANAVFEFMDDNGGGPFSMFVSNGTYNIGGWTAANSIIIQGAGMYRTIFNLTSSDSSVAAADDIVWRNLQLHSVVDGLSHIIASGDMDFEWVFFNLSLSSPSANGVIRALKVGGQYSITHSELRGGKFGAARFYFFTWAADIDRIVVNGFLVPLVETSLNGGFTRLFTSSGSRTHNLLKALHVDIVNITAGSNNDSGFFHANDPEGEVTIYEDFTFRGGLFNDSTDQQFELSPISHYIYYTDVNMRFRTHMYGADRYTKATGVTLIGDTTVFSAFDHPVIVAAELWRESVITASYFESATLTYNSYLRKGTVTTSIFNGSRINIADENAAGVPKEIYIVANQWNNSLGNFDDAITFQQTGDWGDTLIHVADCSFNGVGDVLQSGQIPTQPLKIEFYGNKVHDWGSAVKPQLFNMPARDDNVTIWAFNDELEIDAPPFDDWNPVRPQDKLKNVQWLDIDDDTVYHSEQVMNATIPSGSGSVTITHSLPERGPNTSALVTPTSDLANCTYFWVPWSGFSDTQLQIVIGAAGAQKNCDDDVTFVVRLKMSP